MILSSKRCTAPKWWPSSDLVLPTVLLSAGLLCNGLTCQARGNPEQASERLSAKRRTLIGKVLRFDGKAATNATVTLTRSVPFTNWENRILEVVRAKTDDRGRFKAELISGHTYTAWAITELSGSRYRATRFYTRTFAGSPLVMREYERIRHRIHLRLKGRLAWQKRGPLRCEVQLPNASGEWQTFKPDREGLAILPPLPDAGVGIRILNHEGCQLLNPEQLFLDLVDYDGEVIDLDLGQPYPLAIRVRADTRDGPPIAGARIFSTGFGESHRQIAVTNVSGLAYFEYPANSWKMFDLSLRYVVQAEGRGEVQGTLILSDLDAERTMQALKASEQVDDEAVMMKGHVLGGRLWFSQNRPAANVTVRLDVAMPLSPEVTSQGLPILTRTDEKGRFTFESRNHGFAYRLSCYIDPSRLPNRQVHTDYPLQGLILLAQDIRGSLKDHRLDDVFLDRMQTLRIDVRDANSHPIQAPALHFADARSSFGKKDSVPDSLLYIGSASGKLSILLPSTFDRGLLIAVSPKSDGTLLIPRTLSDTPLKITLRPSTTMQGRVVDENNKPVANARISHSREWQPGDLPQFDYPWSFEPITTNADGTFKIEVATNRTYLLLVGHPGTSAVYQIATQERIEVATTPTTDITITLPPPK